MADTIIIKIKVDADPAAARKVADAIEDIGDEARKAKGPLDEIVTGGLRQIGVLATNALANAGAAAVGFGRDSLTAAANFEDAMGDVAAISGATGEDFDALRQTALDLGAETAFSASQAAEGMKLLSQAGFDVEQTIGAIPGVLSAAAAGGVDLATAADVVANTLRGFGLAAEDSAHVADVLAMAANRSNADITTLGESMKYAAPVAAALGVSMEDATAAIGRMHDAGIKGSMAGTALRGILTRLAAPTNKAAAEMARLGINVFDAQGKMLPLPELVGHVSERFEGLTDSQRAHALSVMVGQEAMSGFLALMKAGPENLGDFSQALLDSGGAATSVADIQLADFNGAMEALGGSVETFQIELLSGALPALAAFTNDGLIPAVNAATDFLPVLFEAGAFLKDALVPALEGLGAAGLVYAYVQAPALIASVTASTTAFLAQAGAIALAAAPYVAIAAAVAAVAWAYDNFQDKVTDATGALLDSRKWWTDSTEAIAEYESSLAGASPEIDATAATIKELRRQIEEETRSLGERMAAGAVSEDQYNREIAQINQKADALQVATGYMDREVQALTDQAAAGMTATNALEDMTAGHADLIPMVQLTLAEIEALGKQIQTTYQEGGQALSTYVATETEFLSGITERRTAHEEAMAALIAEKEGAKTEAQRVAIDERIAAEAEAYRTQETNAAAAYSQQQAAQRAHLGTMLLDYVNAQISLGNIGAERAQAITDALVEEYGIQGDSAAGMFASMAAAIDEYAAGTGEDVAGLIGDLRANEQAAIDTKQAMDELSGQYTAEAVTNFLETKQDADDYARTLRGIPAEVRTRVVTTYAEERTGPGGRGTATSGTRGGVGYSGTRAMGGPVTGGQLYEVAEGGAPELLVSGGRTFLLMGAQGGQVVPAAPAQPSTATPTPEALGGGGGGIQVTVAPVFQGTVVDNEARLEQLAARIADMTRTTVSKDLAKAVDALILGAGVK
jgi:TP901 family phage tail tape measure protein